MQAGQGIDSSKGKDRRESSSYYRLFLLRFPPPVVASVSPFSGRRSIGTGHKSGEERKGTQGSEETIKEGGMRRRGGGVNGGGKLIMREEERP